MPAGSKSGEKRGAPRGKNRATQERERRFAEAEAAAIAALTPEQIDKITPKEVTELAFRTALRAGHLLLAQKLSVDTLAYSHAKRAPKADDDTEDTRDIVITGGLPDASSDPPADTPPEASGNLPDGPTPSS
jgi:hypothetical protein